LKRLLATLATIAALGVLVGITARLIIALENEIAVRMDELKGKTVTAIEDLVGRRITYSGISPSFLQYLEIRDLVIHDSTNAPRPLIAIRRVRVYYSLAHLLLRRDAVGSLKEIKILNTAFALDTGKDRDIVELLRRLGNSGAGGSPLRARITGADVDLVLRTGDLSLRLSSLFFQFEARKDAIDVSFRSEVSAKLKTGFDFETTIRGAGKLDPHFEGADLTIGLRSFQSPLLSSGGQTLQVVWKGKNLEVRKIQDRSRIDVRLAANLDAGKITVNFALDQLRPDRLLRFGGKLARYAIWFAIPISAKGHVAYTLAGGKMEYGLEASALFEDQLPVKDVQFSSSISGTEKQTFFHPLALSTPLGAVEFDGDIVLDTFMPEGTLTLRDLAILPGQTVSTVVSIERQEGKLQAEGTFLELGQVGFNAFRVTVSPRESGASFFLRTSFPGMARGDYIEANGELQLDRAMSVSGSGLTVAFRGAPKISLKASLRNLPLDRIYHLYTGAGELSPEQSNLAGVLSRFTITSELLAETDFSRFSLSSARVTIAEPADSTVFARFAMAVDNEGFRVRDFTGGWNGFALDGAVEGRFAAGGEIGFSSDIRFKGIPYSLKGSYSERLGLRASGSYGLDLSLSGSADGGVTVLAKGDHFPVALPERTYAVSFEAEGAFGGAGDWYFDFPAFAVYDLPFLESKRNVLELSLRLAPNRLEVGRMKFTDAFSTLEGTAGADLAFDSDLFAPQFLERLAIKFDVQLRAIASTTAPVEEYRVKGSCTGGTLSVSMEYTGSPLSRLTNAAIRGRLSGSATVSGPLRLPTIEVSISLVDGRLGTDPLALSAKAGILPGSIQIRRLGVGYLSHKLTDGSGYIDLKNGTFSIVAGYRGEYFNDDVDLTGILAGKFAAGELGRLLDAPMDQTLEGKLSLSGITVAKRPFPSWSISFSAERGMLSFHGGPGNSVRGTIDSALAFTVQLGRPFPLEGRVAGRLIGDRISATVDAQSIDLLVLNPLLKTPIITVTAGVATGRLGIEGPVNDPDYIGELELVGGGLTCAYSPDEAGPISGRLIFDHREVRSTRLRAAAGTTRLAGGFSITIDHWTPSTFDVEIGTERNTAAHLASRFGRVIADGHASGQMRVTGSERKTEVVGDIIVADCRITLGEYPGGKFVPEDPPTFVTLNAQTGKRVEFSWPTELFPLIRATASPGGKLRVTYRGDTGAYTVKGTTDVQRGEIYYFDRSFRLKKGTIAFDENERDFDPRIKARAEVREWDPRTGEEVKIYLDADGTLNKFTPRFSSDPSRTENDLLAMIGAPILSRAGSQGLGMSAALLTSDILSQSWILRPFEQKVRELLGLDMFSIRTQLLQNLVAERLLGTTINPLDNTSVSLGKYLGNDLFLEMLVRLQSPAPLSGMGYFLPGTGYYVPGQGNLPGTLPVPLLLPAAGPGINAELELTLEWTTPFFLLEWTFIPKDPESLFLKDNSLSFSWKLSY
jgi:hypothetical protein